MASIETVNIGKAVAARVGTNIREVRTKLGLTQAQLSAPEFSISYISAIERGKIRPSLKALSILAKRLDVPLTFLLEGSPAGAADARAVGYSPTDSDSDQLINVDLLQADVLIQQHEYAKAKELLTPIQPDRISTVQAYRLYLLRGQIHLGLHENQEAVVELRAAVSQGEVLGDFEFAQRARNLLGKAYFLLYNYTLALENHARCANALENQQNEEDKKKHEGRNHYEGETAMEIHPSIKTNRIISDQFHRSFLKSSRDQLGFSQKNFAHSSQRYCSRTQVKRT